MAAAHATTSFGSDLGTVMISIYAGKEEKLFVVHKALLTSQSDYFRKALSGGFKEAEENKIYLDEDDPAAVELLIAFIYLGIIPRPGARKASPKALPTLPTLPPQQLSAANSAPDSVTAPSASNSSTPFRPVDIRDPNYLTMVNRHLHICHDNSYRHLSPEELRLADYQPGRKYGGSQDRAQLQLQPAIAVQDSAAVYQLQMPPPSGSLVGGGWSFSPESDKFRGALLGSATSAQIPGVRHASSSLGEAPLPSSPMRSSALFGQASPLSNPLARNSSSPWAAGNNSVANPSNEPSTPTPSTMTRVKPEVLVDPKVEALSTSSSAPTTSQSAQTLDASASRLTGFAKYANRPLHPAVATPPIKSVLTGRVATKPDNESIPKSSELTGFAEFVTPSDNSFGGPTPKPSTTTTSVFGKPARSGLSTPKPIATTTSIFGSPARGITSTPKPIAATTSVFGSPAQPSISSSTTTSMPAPVRLTHNQRKAKAAQMESTGVSLSADVPSDPGSLNGAFPTPTAELSSDASTQTPGRGLGGFGSSSATITCPNTGGDSLEVSPASEIIRDLVAEEVAHQEALLNLCIVGETFCWPELFNAAVDSYVQGERSLRRDILVSHIDRVYERTHSNSPLRDFVLDSMRGLEDGAITIKEYMVLAYTHEDFMKGVLLKLGKTNAEKSAQVFGGSKEKSYHMAKNTSGFGVSRHENAITTAPTSRTKLTMTLAEFRSTYLSKSGKPFDQVVVGAIIHKDGGRRILLLRRAEHETHHPDMFELPSGKVEDEDATLGAALRREVAEETGLCITSIVREMEPFEHVVSKTVDGVVVAKSCLQLNFIVNVGDGEVKVNPHEHSVAVWADMADLTRLEMTDEMSNLVATAFHELLLEMIIKDGDKEK